MYGQYWEGKVEITENSLPCINVFCASLGNPEKVKDVLFLVGGSSVYHYNTAIKLLPEIAEKQQSSNTLFALIRYAAIASLQVPFQDKTNFTREVANVYWTGQGDSLEEGLDIVPRVFTEYGRPDAERVLVVFVSDDDDTPRNVFIKVDIKMKKNGVRVIPVVIGEQTEDNNLTEIHPKKKKPLITKPGDDQKDITDKISEIVFKGARLFMSWSLIFLSLFMVH